MNPQEEFHETHLLIYGLQLNNSFLQFLQYSQQEKILVSNKMYT